MLCRMILFYTIIKIFYMYEKLIMRIMWWCITDKYDNLISTFYNALGLYILHWNKILEHLYDSIILLGFLLLPIYLYWYNDVFWTSEYSRCNFLQIKSAILVTVLLFLWIINVNWQFSSLFFTICCALTHRQAWEFVYKVLCHISRNPWL